MYLLSTERRLRLWGLSKVSSTDPRRSHCMVQIREETLTYKLNSLAYQIANLVSNIACVFLISCTWAMMAASLLDRGIDYLISRREIATGKGRSDCASSQGGVPRYVWNQTGAISWVETLHRAAAWWSQLDGQLGLSVECQTGRRSTRTSPQGGRQPGHRRGVTVTIIHQNTHRPARRRFHYEFSRPRSFFFHQTNEKIRRRPVDEAISSFRRRERGALYIEHPLQ